MVAADENTDYPANGDLRLVLEGAIAAKGRTQKERGNLELDLMRRNTLWQPEAWGFSYDYNTADHYGTAGLLEREDRVTGEVRLTIGADPWVPGDAARYSLQLKRNGRQFTGTYKGVFGERAVEGRVSGTLKEPYPAVTPAEFVPVQAGEHPRLVFRKTEADRVRQRIQTEWGAAMVERLRERLTREIIYTGDYGSNAAYFAAGNAFLHFLTGEPEALTAARTITEKVMQSPPSKGGHQYAFSHPLLGLALAYDFCYDAWDAAFREQVARYLEATSALVIAGRGKGFNHSPGSNWVARTRGGAGVALLAIRGDRGASEEVERLYRVCERSAARFFVFGAGEHGFGGEGDGYHVESMEMMLPLVHAARTVRGVDLTAGEIGQAAAWTLPLFALRSFPQDGEPHLHRYGRHGEASRRTPSSLFCLGVSAVRTAHLPAIYDFIQRFWGMGGDRTFGIESPHHAAFVLPLYPETVTPEDYRAVLPRVLRDERKGFFVFRSGDFVTTLYAKTDPSYGWNFPEAGTFRIHGLETDWVVRAGVGPRESENITLVRAPEVSGGGLGRVLLFEAKPDGSGAVTMDLAEAHRQGKERKDVGIRSERAFSVDYSGVSGAPALFVLADRVRGGSERVWLLHTMGDAVRQEAQGFTIEGKDGATLRATFIEPAPVRLLIRPNEENRAITTIEARNDSTQAAQFVVVMTVQKGNAPEVTVQGTGKNRIVRVGTQEIRFEEERRSP